MVAVITVDVIDREGKHLLKTTFPFTVLSCFLSAVSVVNEVVRHRLETDAVVPVDHVLLIPVHLSHDGKYSSREPFQSTMMMTIVATLDIVNDDKTIH